MRDNDLARVADVVKSAAALKPVTCPNCGHAFALEITAKHAPESIIHWRIHPHKGELMDARTVGETLSSVRDLLRSVGKELGTPTEVLVKSVTTSEDGAIDFELLIVRFKAVADREDRKRSRRKARAAGGAT